MAAVYSLEGCACRLGVVADVGQTLNSSVTYQQLVLDKPDVRTHG